MSIKQESTHKLLLGTYYHLAHPSSHLLWNATLSKGFVYSASVQADVEGLEGITTDYHSANAHQSKEALWERVRESAYRHRPTRMKAFFLLDDLATARKMSEVWFPGQKRHILSVRITTVAAVHRADAKWLDTEESEWQFAAQQYWGGSMTAEPIPEIIVYGVVYFPGWAEKPFGIPEGWIGG